MRSFAKVLAWIGIALVTVGCAGTQPGSSNRGIPSRIRVLAHAPTPGSGSGISQLTGFVDGKPAFLSYIDAAHWTVSAMGASPVSLSTVSYAHAFLVAFEDGTAVGEYDGGTFVYRKGNSGWTAASFPGVTEAVLDAQNAKLIGKVGSGFAIVDIATAAQTPITLPADAALYFAKSNWLVYGTASTFHVRNVQSGTDWQEAIVSGDTNQFPYALNASGGVVGESSNGSVGRAVYWEPGTGAAHVVDSFTGGTVEPGWISDDGARFAINIATGSTYRSYLYVDGAKYPVSNLVGGSGVSYVYGLNESGTTGFGLIDPSGDRASLVALSIGYR
ncbi:MAG: hypothetical protein QOJ65_2597 [Fimbriimonadaceae bacterium]|jgi:hypothetical protein|nr:hypothetical protein [Fimbriimonadaceae bacterium]